MSALETRHAPSPESRPSASGRRRVPPLLLWFAVLGGITAWAVHLFLAWSVMEISCFAPGTGSDIDQHGGSPGTGALTTTYLATGVPLLVALAAFATCLVLRRRCRALGEEEGADQLALERTGLLLVIGIFLDLMSVAAIVGGAFALAVLEPCG